LLLDAPDDTSRASAPEDALPAPEPHSGSRPRSGVRFARLAGLVAVAILAGLIHPRALTAVAVIGTVLAVGLFGPWLVVRGVRAHWTYPVRRAQVGRPLTVHLTLRSVSPWPVFGLLVRGGWTHPDAARKDPVAIAVPRLPARGVREVVATTVPDRRGVFPPHSPTLVSGFPFGLRQVRRPADVAGQVLVWPEIVPLAARERDATGVEGGAVVQSARSGDRGEFVGTRPYRAGEPLHRIHWKQSARHDKLIAVESRATARRAVVLVLETAPEIHSTESGETLERMLCVGASLAAGLTEMGIHVTLTFEKADVFSAITRPQLATALDAMARFRPADGAGQDDLLTQLSGRAARGLVPWVITTVTGWGRAVEAARTSRRRFVVIDERKPWVVRNAPRPPGFPRNAPLIPLDDPGHHGLLIAWKEVAGGLHGLV
jgi:uncharacterized protein (DUF58 family)